MYSEYEQLTLHRKRLKNDHSMIEVTDFGAGSRIFKSHRRKVKAIAKHAGISPKRQRLLFRLSQFFQPKNTLELGTSLGMATIALASGNKQGTVTSVEGCAATAKKAREHFNGLSAENIQIEHADFPEFFESQGPLAFDMAYIDGNHSKEATLQNFEALLPYVQNHSVLIFDDIYWSKEMTEAWREILAHPKVTVSIDTFQWGLVFFRKEQRKEHFVIRV